MTQVFVWEFNSHTKIESDTQQTNYQPIRFPPKVLICRLFAEFLNEFLLKSDDLF